jgi:hypothetical protein
MKLNQIASKPKLIEITLDDEDTIKEYGEPLSFHTWDRQPLSIFIRLASIEQNNFSSVIDSVRDLVLDEKGHKILTEEITLPTPVMMRVIAKVVDSMGK